MTRDVILLTPGPLTTRPKTRRAMLRDWGSRDAAFIALTAEMRVRQRSDRLGGLIAQFGIGQSLA
jgi:aspartate aminotransferase-like enzyme